MDLLAIWKTSILSSLMRNPGFLNIARWFNAFANGCDILKPEH
jgi:hypothetical protein